MTYLKKILVLAVLFQTPFCVQSYAQTTILSDPKVASELNTARNTLAGHRQILTAHESAGTRGGGDAVQSEMKALGAWLRSGELNKLVLKYIPQIDPDKAYSKDAAVIWEFMISNGLEADVKASHYDPESQCAVGSDPDAAASAVIGGKILSQEDVCFNTEKIVVERMTLSSLITLAFHEHAHHLGLGETSAYLISEMVGAQLTTLLEDSSSSVSGDLDTDPKMSKLAVSIKKGSTLKILNDLSSMQYVAIYKGKAYGSTNEIHSGVFCWLQGNLKAGRTYKIIGALGGWSDTRQNGITTPDVQFAFESTSALLTCERMPDQGSQLTVREISETLKGLFDFDFKIK